MALSRIVAFGNGSTTQFAIPFALGYIRRSDISCRVGTEVDGAGNPVYRALTFLSDELVDVALPVVEAGVRIEFTRTVDRTQLLVDYEDGDIINEENMNTAQRQAIMLVHETLDGRFEQFQNDLPMGGFRILDLGAPVGAADAATKAYVDSNISTGAANAAIAVAAAQSAQASATTATSQASAANTARVAAEAARTAAAASQTAAATSATNAGTSATTATTAATTASTARDQSVAARTGSEAARDAAVVANTAAQSARTDAIAARTGSETARDAAVLARNEAVAARNTAVAAETAVLGYMDAVSWWKGTQAQYDAIVTKDPEMLYFIRPA